MVGGVGEMQKRLANENTMKAVWPQMQANLERRGGAQALLITGESKYRGKTLQQLASQYHLDVLPMAVEIILAGDPAIASFMMRPDDVKHLMVQPWVVTGSDGTVGHPRKYGSFPKKFETYVVANKLISIEQFVRQSSSLTAEIFGLCDRGRLEVGLNADIAVWSADGFRSNATYENPTEFAQGVQYLIVNGKIVIDNEVLTEFRAGKVIDARRCTPRCTSRCTK
jgi:N-acyl-D-aspartate/D-glutamate deacylase